MIAIFPRLENRDMSSTIFALPTRDRYFEDYVVGSVLRFGPITVEEQEMIAFARQFDPQYFHTDPEAAKSSIFGGLVASGFHTCSLMMRLYAEHYLSEASSLASPGMDELRWPTPVRPGDRLSVRVTVQDAMRSRSKPDLGIVHSFIEVLNQAEKVVFSAKCVNFMRCRGEANVQ